MHKDLRLKDNSNIRLNKYIASSGFCSRRKADEYILSGAVKVNDKPITEMGFKISTKDKVYVNNQLIKISQDYIYIALNKPKDYISTKNDELNRKTIYTLLDHGIRNKVFSVGRLDRNTTGIILFTNDGNLSHLLTHPSSNIHKEYRVILNRDLSEEDYKKLKKGITIDNEVFKIKKINFNSDKLNDVSITIHYGKNRIVRRIFESLDFKVKQLDRISFADITKNGLDKGKYRFLSVKEIRMLKNIVIK